MAVLRQLRGLAVPLPAQPGSAAAAGWESGCAQVLLVAKTPELPVTSVWQSAVGSAVAEQSHDCCRDQYTKGRLPGLHRLLHYLEWQTAAAVDRWLAPASEVVAGRPAG